MRVYIAISVICFLLSYFLGLYTQTPSTPIYTNQYYHNISFSSILKTNLTVILQIFSGSILFGFPTFLAITTNGFNLGLYTEDACSKDALTVFLLLTLPHGILEIPAIIIAGAAGFKIPYEVIRYLAGKKEQILTKEDIKEYLALALISIILIVIAAWIEANITLRIAETMLNSTKGI